MPDRDVRLAVVLGGVGAGVVLGAYIFGLLLHGRSDVPRAVAYNGPIAVLFLMIGSYLAVRLIRLGLLGFMRAHAAELVLWVLGIGLLYLRLGRRSVEVSGHLAWLPLPTAQSWAYGFPRVVVAVGIAATLTACYLKFAVFRGPSGAPGALAGVCLAGGFLLSRRRARIAP